MSEFEQPFLPTVSRFHEQNHAPFAQDEGDCDGTRLVSFSQDVFSFHFYCRDTSFLSWHNPPCFLFVCLQKCARFGRRSDCHIYVRQKDLLELDRLQSPNLRDGREVVFRISDLLRHILRTSPFSKSSNSPNAERGLGWGHPYQQLARISPRNTVNKGFFGSWEVV